MEKKVKSGEDEINLLNKEKWDLNEKFQQVSKQAADEREYIKSECVIL